MAWPVLFNPKLEDLLINSLEHLRKRSMREDLEVGLDYNLTEDVLGFVTSNYAAFIEERRLRDIDEAKEIGKIRTHLLNLVNQYIDVVIKKQPVTNPLPIDYRETGREYEDLLSS
ncbi:hypothetical protein GOV05_03055 [Candidatus Woesearchaeota archaeon]|nr:hypothetical protein [Candidatus Woesearchaeota archaeon]